MILSPRTEDVAAACEALVTRALRRATATGQPQLAVHTFAPVPPCDPLAAWLCGRERFGDAAYVASPSEVRALCGLGIARELTAGGPQPVPAIAAALRELGAEVDAATAALDGPFALGGFAFDPDGGRAAEWADFPASRLIVPRILVERRAGETSVTLALHVDPGDDARRLVERAFAELDELPPAPAPPAGPSALVTTADPTDWAASVARTAADVRAGRFAKLVLARRLRVRFRGAVDPAAALERMRSADPHAYVFAFARGARWFVGASPERLVALAGGRFTIDGLAGTSARGATYAEDERLAAELLASPKERHEHALVVEAIRRDLDGLGGDLDIPPHPALRTIRQLRHLWTPIGGRLVAGRSVLDLVGRLHPTPAVAGLPRERALPAIREREGFDRGWYGGPVGWVDASGAGEFAVAIRSALVGPSEAFLYAGCGIVGDSDPAAELAEAELKLRTMTGALALA